MGTGNAFVHVGTWRRYVQNITTTLTTMVVTFELPAPVVPPLSVIGFADTGFSLIPGRGAVEVTNVDDGLGVVVLFSGIEDVILDSALSSGRAEGVDRADVVDVVGSFVTDGLVVASVGVGEGFDTVARGGEGAGVVVYRLYQWLSFNVMQSGTYDFCCSTRWLHSSACCWWRWVDRYRGCWIRSKQSTQKRRCIPSSIL